MPRDSSVYLDDILDAINAIRDYTQSLTRDDFARDRKTVDAVGRSRARMVRLHLVGALPGGRARGRTSSAG
jgi:uncharacterized protein with HEPN domain